MHDSDLREASRAVVLAHRSGDTEALAIAKARLATLTGDDRPAPGFFRGPLCDRYLTGPVEKCAKFRNHSGPCLRERDITKETPRHAD